jgi:hypothetical protein
METFIEGIKSALFKPINKAAISIMGVFTVLWGLWVANPMWAVFTQAPIFHIMAFLAPEWAWGIAAILVGITMLWGVFKMQYRPLIFGARSGFYFWIFASITFFIGDWKNTGGITLLMIALYCGYIALNLSINREQYQEE